MLKNAGDVSMTLVLQMGDNGYKSQSPLNHAVIALARICWIDEG